jgi:hypothetical protein
VRAQFKEILKMTDEMTDREITIWNAAINTVILYLRESNIPDLDYCIDQDIKPLRKKREQDAKAECNVDRKPRRRSVPAERDNTTDLPMAVAFA